MDLLKSIKLYSPANAVALANNTDDNSAAIDTQGFDGVLFLTTIADSVDTGVATLTVEQDAASDGSFAALAGAVAAATSAADDDLNTKILAVNVFRPRKRYVRANRKSATANIAFDNVIAILYRGSKFPVAQLAAEVAASAVVTSPAES